MKEKKKEKGVLYNTRSWWFLFTKRRIAAAGILQNAQRPNDTKVSWSGLGKWVGPIGGTVLGKWTWNLIRSVS